MLAAWKDIYLEFIDGMQDENGKRRVKLESEVEILKDIYQKIQLYVMRLKLGPAEWILDKLRLLTRVTGKFDPNDKEGYFRDLQVILNRSNALVQKIDEKEAQLKVTMPKTGEKPSYKQWAHVVARVSTYCKFHLNTREIMTAEFMEYHQQMVHSEEMLKAQVTKPKSARVI